MGTCNHPKDEPCFWEQTSGYYREKSSGRVLYNPYYAGFLTRASQQEKEITNATRQAVGDERTRLQKERKTKNRQKWERHGSDKKRLRQIQDRIGSLQCAHDEYTEMYYSHDYHHYSHDDRLPDSWHQPGTSHKLTVDPRLPGWQIAPVSFPDEKLQMVGGTCAWRRH